MKPICKNCKWWKPFELGRGWDGFGECNNPLFYLYKRDESERLNGRYDRVCDMGAVGKDFGCVKFEPKT